MGKAPAGAGSSLTKLSTQARMAPASPSIAGPYAAELIVQNLSDTVLDHEVNGAPGYARVQPANAVCEDLFCWRAPGDPGLSHNMGHYGKSASVAECALVRLPPFRLLLALRQPLLEDDVVLQRICVVLRLKLQLGLQIRSPLLKPGKRSPLLGEHTEELLREVLGFDAAKAAEYVASPTLGGAVGGRVAERAAGLSLGSAPAAAPPWGLINQA
jgi:hypothetical protein